MVWLQRHAWWGLLAMAAGLSAKGLVDLVSGVTYQAQDVTGTSIVEIGAESGAGLKLADYSVRIGGLYLMAAGVLASAVLLFAFRHERPWAWWLMWTLPALAIAESVLEYRGVPGPAVTGAIVGALAVAILLVSAPRFVTSNGRR
jgi:hypothetical protein